jgi:AcrR family transcriptional regulator
MNTPRTARPSVIEGGRLSREDWINGAIRFLAVSGVDAIRLDSLATALGVTKGRFVRPF